MSGEYAVDLGDKDNVETRTEEQERCAKYAS